MMAAAGMLRAELVAPCGMDCARCSGYLAEYYDLPRKQGITRCRGCRPRGKMCAYIKKQCKLLLENKITYCYECPGFPCHNLAHLDARYRTRYQTSPIANLQVIQREGMAAFLESEAERYRCPRCEGLLCVHNGKCYKCDKVESWRG